MAKLMPTQWRTTAPIVGQTPHNVWNATRNFSMKPKPRRTRNLDLLVPGMKRGPVQTTLGNFDLEKSTLTQKQSLRGLIQLTWTRMVSFIDPFVGEILDAPVTQSRNVIRSSCSPCQYSGQEGKTKDQGASAGGSTTISGLAEEART